MKIGSSPRGRGTSRHPGGRAADDRVIPAWAGNIRRPARPGQQGAGHPRVGGEHDDATISAVVSGGSSPRGRGTLLVADDGERWYPGHPRVGGEHMTIPVRPQADETSSPRGRGTYSERDAERRAWRVIPAWAGNIPTRR